MHIFKEKRIEYNAEKSKEVLHDGRFHRVALRRPVL